MGEIIKIRGNQVCSDRYFKFTPAEIPVKHDNLAEFSKDLDKVLLSVFTRMIEQTPGVNRWIVPLSGGHDSRTIVNYLYKLGVKNVICYSYGTLNNEQSKIHHQPDIIAL